MLKIFYILQTRKVPVGRTLTFQKNIFIYFNKSPLKIMRNNFHFILKALFVLEIFKFVA